MRISENFQMQDMGMRFHQMGEYRMRGVGLVSSRKLCASASLCENILTGEEVN